MRRQLWQHKRQNHRYLVEEARLCSKGCWPVIRTTRASSEMPLSRTNTLREISSRWEIWIAPFAHLKRANQELDESVLRAAPDDPGNKMGLAIDLSQWAEYYQGKNDIAKAIEYTRASLTIRRELAAADPKDHLGEGQALLHPDSRLGDLQLGVSANSMRWQKPIRRRNIDCGTTPDAVAALRAERIGDFDFLGHGARHTESSAMFSAPAPHTPNR